MVSGVAHACGIVDEVEKTSLLHLVWISVPLELIEVSELAPDCVTESPFWLI